MKILMLNNEYPPLGGGQASANRSIIEALCSGKDQVNVDLITSSVNEYKVEKTGIGTIYYLNIGKKNRNVHFQNVKDLILFSIKSFYLGLKIIKKKKYDIIVAWAGVPSGFIAFLLHKIHKTPFTVLLRGPDVPFHEDKWKFLDKVLLQFISPVIWKNASSVIANSEILKNLALRIAPTQKITVIENGIDYNFWKNNSKKQLSDFEKIIVLSVGRISKIKGFDNVILAIGRLPVKNLEYWIVGDGPEKNNLKILSQRYHCENQIKFLGIKNKNELKQIYQNSTLFCLPSFNEGMSNALLEAMASGLPVIVTNVGGTKELVKGNGIIVEKGDPISIADAISLIIKDTSTYTKMSDNSAEICKGRTWKNQTTQLLKQIQIS